MIALVLCASLVGLCLGIIGGMAYALAEIAYQRRAKK